MPRGKDCWNLGWSPLEEPAAGAEGGDRRKCIKSQARNSKRKNIDEEGPASG